MVSTYNKYKEGNKRTVKYYISYCRMYSLCVCISEKYIYGNKPSTVCKEPLSDKDVAPCGKVKASES